MSDHTQVALIVGLVATVLFSAVTAIYSKHESRKAFVELQGLLSEKDRMEIYWGKLQLEQGAFTAHGKIENDAKANLGMISPGTTEIIVVKP
jgi:cell division protein FtsL